jgi:hypothetical protein
LADDQRSGIQLENAPVDWGPQVNIIGTIIVISFSCFQFGRESILKRLCKYHLAGRDSKTVLIAQQ